MKDDFDEFDEPAYEEEEEDEGLPEIKGSDGFFTSETENWQPKPLDEKQVEVVGVFEQHEQGMPLGASPHAFVLLRDNQGRQVLIWVGRAEAYAISVALESITFDRPMTHDLLKNVIERLEGKVESVLIDDLWHDTYYAKISVFRKGETIQIDSRPSDAIALALRCKAPIFMAESVLQTAGVSTEE